jgi:hypothetical protein
MMYVNHSNGCPVRHKHSDAAKRIADVYTMHRLADPYGNIGYWIACALLDGKSDNALYETKQDAIRHQHHKDNWYTFIQIVPSQMTPCEAEVMLKVARMAYDNGARMTDGMSRNDLIRRLGWEDQIALSRGRVQNIVIGRMN